MSEEGESGEPPLPPEEEERRRIRGLSDDDFFQELDAELEEPSETRPFRLYGEELRRRSEGTVLPEGFLERLMEAAAQIQFQLPNRLEQQYNPDRDIENMSEAEIDEALKQWEQHVEEFRRRNDTERER